MTESYSCCLAFGNMSSFETEQHLKVVKSFIASFRLKDSSVKKREIDGYAVYEAYMTYEHQSAVKCMHFAQCVSSFALLHGIQILELPFPL